MKKNYFSFTLLILALFYPHSGRLEVTPPQENFDYQQFLVFMPGNKLGDLPEKGETIHQESGYTISRHHITDKSYKFPLFVLSQKDEIIEFYARLPSYFLHDVFHQSLINHMGKQDQYLNRDEHSVYIWNDFENNIHHYEGTCTITCFPIFYRVISKKNEDKKNVPSIMKILERQPF